MKVKDMIKLARQDNYLGFEYLDAHYSPILKANVRKKYGEEAAEKMVELVPSLIEYYIKNGIKDNLDSFLNKKANALFKYHKRKNVIGSSVSVKDKENFYLVVNHYGNHFYNRVFKYNMIFSEEELRKFCYLFIETRLKKAVNGHVDIRVSMLNTIQREEKVYFKDKENLIKRYMIMMGLNDKILNYFSNKYRYLFKKYKNNKMYDCLVNNYESFVLDSLKEITTVNQNIELIIIKKLTTKYFETKEKIKAIIDEGRYSEENYNLIYNTYSYVKKIIYDRYSPITYLTDEDLKKRIDKKYQDYLKAYLNGNKSKNPGSYINTRLVMYFDGYVGEKIEGNSYKTDEYYENEFYVEKVLRNLDACYPRSLAEKELKETYDKYFKTKYLKQRKTDTKEAVRSALMRRINMINTLYQEQDIKDMALKYKQTIPNDVLEKNVLENVIDNLVSYYVNMGINNKETFESLLIKVLLNFDKKVYEDLDMLKKQEQCKVLNKHKN